MTRHSRSQSDDLKFPILVILGVTAWVHRTQLIHIALILVSVAASFMLLKLLGGSLHRRKFLRHQNVYDMNGIDFEQYVATLLLANGFRNVTLTEKYDFGVDITAEKYGLRWGKQVKRHSDLVKASAVRQVVTGLRIYGCDRAMVITNSSYSEVARTLADANDCVLVDGIELHRLAQQGCIL